MELGGRRALCVLFYASFLLAAVSPTASASEADLWPEYASFGTKNQFIANTMNTQIPVAYFETITDVIIVRINGYLSFGQDYSGPRPTPSNWPFSTKILAAYWVDVNTTNRETLPLVYTYLDDSRLGEVTHESSLVKHVKKVVADPEFEPLMVLAVTWEGVRPREMDKFPNDTATFQLLLAWDSRVTYAVRSYQQVWHSPELAAETYYAGTYSQGRGQRPKVTTPGNNSGPEVILLASQKANKDPYICVYKARASITSLNASIHALPPCPCHAKQASRDPQFKTSNLYQGCYQSVDPPPGGSLLQLCCYNQFGMLVNYTDEAKVPVSTDPDRSSLGEAYYACCTKAFGLCLWFYTQIHRPDCVNDMTLLETTTLPRITNSFEHITLTASPSTKSELYTRFAVPNKGPVTYNLSGDFNTTQGVAYHHGGFTFNISQGLPELRKLSFPRELLVYATDEHGLSAVDANLYTLCLCEQTAQCNNASFPFRVDYNNRALPGYLGPDTYERGNVNILVCDCRGVGTGRFCEKPIDPCHDCLIRHKSVCHSNPKDYCPPCPLGYHRDGTQCRAGTRSGYITSTAQICVVVTLAFLSSALPWQ